MNLEKLKYPRISPSGAEGMNLKVYDIKALRQSRAPSVEAPIFVGR